MTGVTTPNLPTANLIDDLIGNAGGNTVRILPERLAAMLASSGFFATSERVAALEAIALDLGPIHPDTTAGLAASADGQQFRVASADPATVAYHTYQRDSAAVATLIASVPAAAALADKADADDLEDLRAGVFPGTLAGLAAAPLPRLLGHTSHVLADLTAVPDEYATVANYPVNTWVIVDGQFDAAGSVRQLELYAKAAGTISVGVFSAGPSGMTLRASEAVTVLPGYNLANPQLDVRRGDLLAIRQSAEIIPATSNASGQQEYMNNYMREFRTTSDTPAFVVGVTLGSRGVGALWLATIDIEDGAGANQRYRDGGLAADWLMMSAFTSGSEPHGYKNVGHPAVTSVADSLYITQGVPRSLAASDMSSARDNPFLHAILCYKQLLRGKGGLRHADFEHRVVPNKFGGESDAGIPVALTTPEIPNLLFTAPLIKAAHRKVLPFLVNIAGERDGNTFANAAEVAAGLTAFHDRWRQSIAVARSTAVAGPADPFDGRAPVFMGQYCRFSSLQPRIMDGQLAHALSYPDLHFVNPNYMIGIVSGHNREVSLDGIKQHGAHIGWAMYRHIIRGKHCRPLILMAARTIGGRMEIETNGRDLYADTTLAPAQPNHGLSLHNAAGAIMPITSVTLEGSRIIMETPVEVKTGWAVGYGQSAMTGFPGAQQATWGGNIRENPADLVTYEGYPCTRWMAVHRTPISTVELASVVMTEAEYLALGGVYAPNTLYHLREA